MWTLLLTWLSPMLSWQPATPRQQTYAVIIGISDYKMLTNRTGDLRYADKDAQQVALFLRSQSGGAVPASHIRVLVNREATQSRVEQALSLFSQAKSGDRVLFYFSGHGLPDSFVTYDVKSDNSGGLLTYQTIKAVFHACQATTKVCIADACLSGGMTYQQTGQAKLVKKVISGVSDTNVAMLLASRSTQSAVEARRLEGGAFTHYLLKGLQGLADLNNDQQITIRELHHYVAPRVRQATQGRQTPVFYGRFSDNMVLSYL